MNALEPLLRGEKMAQEQLAELHRGLLGEVRRATESGRAQLLATTYARDVVQTILISAVATAYLQLRQFDYQLGFSRIYVTFQSSRMAN
jgi:multidrug efflux system outer membrane protein